MNFFEAQSSARTKTAFLVVVFMVAAVCWSVITFLFIFIISILFLDWHLFGSLYDLLFGWQGILTGTLVRDEIAYQEYITEIFTSRAFYAAVFILLCVIGAGIGRGKLLSDAHWATKAMGGQLIDNSPTDEKERMLKNVVSEMSIASGAPMPDIYIMPNDSINAFAAGMTPQNAVIGVTRGALANFNRDQLQGVIAHEFSHIMNGDMRLNTRIIVAIALLTFLGSSGKSMINGIVGNIFSAFPLLFGVLLYIFGLPGMLFGKILQSGISRQREYLADAAAVQYTRNPFGIAGALEILYFKRKGKSVIRGSSVANQEDCGHMMFSNLSSESNIINRIFGIFSTHPPLKKRIVAIFPAWHETNNTINKNTRLRHDSVQSTQSVQDEKHVASGSHARFSGDGAMGFAAATAAVTVIETPALPPTSLEGADKKIENFDGAEVTSVIEKLGTVDAVGLTSAHQLLEKIPAVLLEAGENSYSVRALIYAMLLDKAYTDIRQQQLAHIKKYADIGVYDLTLKLLSEVDKLPQSIRLPLLQLSMPALRQLSEKQYMIFHDNLSQIINMDNKLELFEWCVNAIVIFTLSEHFKLASRKHPNKKAVDNAMSYALSILWRAGGHPNSVTEFGEVIKGFNISYDERTLNSNVLYGSLNTIKNTSPQTIKKFTEAAIACVSHDGKIDDEEACLLRAYLMLLGCPMPLVSNVA